jgi:hypothetical protein
MNVALPDFHDYQTQSVYLHVASLLCAYPGLQAPVAGEGMLPQVINRLLCPADAGPAAIELIRSWREMGIGAFGERWAPKDRGVREWEVDQWEMTYSDAYSETHVHVRLNGVAYAIRSSCIPTLFTLLLPLLPYRSPNQEIGQEEVFACPHWRHAEPTWRSAAMARGFAKLYPNEGESFGLAGEGHTIFVLLNPAAAIHLANARTPTEFFDAARADTQAYDTKYVPREVGG